jgi:WD40 repeat protein
MVHIGELCVEHLLKPVFILIQAGVSCKWAHDSQRFLLEFFDTIQSSPSQVYHFALPLCPPSSWLHKFYTAKFSQEVKVIKGLPAGWGLCTRTVTLANSPLALACWKDTIAVGLKSNHIITLDGITGSQVAVLSGHTNWVESLTFSSDGESLVSGSHDKTLKLWDVQTGGVVKTFHGHSDWVISVSISFDHAQIASGSYDNTIRLWDIQTGECHCVIGQQGRVKFVSFSPANPQHFISISSGDIQQWDINGHQIEPTYKGSHASFSPDGIHFVLCGEGVITVQSSNSGAIVAKCLTDIDSHYCCFSPDGRLVAVAADTTAYVWNITGSDLLLIKTFAEHTGRITSLTFSSSSSLISVSNDQSVKFWQISASSTDLVASGLPASASVGSVSLQAENGIAVSCDSNGVVKTWDISTGLCKATFQIPAKHTLLRDAQMIGGRLVVVWLWEMEIDIWDTKQGKLLHVIRAYGDGARDLRISGDGSKVFLLIGRSIQAWSMWTGEAVGRVELGSQSYLNLLRVGGSRICLRFPSSLIWGWDFEASDSSPVPLLNTSLERHCLYFVGGAGWWYEGPAQVNDAATGKKVFRLHGRYAKPYDVQWDGRYLVAGYRSGEVLILDFNQMFPQ